MSCSWVTGGSCVPRVPSPRSPVVGHGPAVSANPLSPSSGVPHGRDGRLVLGVCGGGCRRAAGVPPRAVVLTESPTARVPDVSLGSVRSQEIAVTGRRGAWDSAGEGGGGGLRFGVSWGVPTETVSFLFRWWVRPSSLDCLTTTFQPV